MGYLWMPLSGVSLVLWIVGSRSGAKHRKQTVAPFDKCIVRHLQSLTGSVRSGRMTMP